MEAQKPTPQISAEDIAREVEELLPRLDKRLQSYLHHARAHKAVALYALHYSLCSLTVKTRRTLLEAGADERTVEQLGRTAAGAPPRPTFGERLVRAVRG